MARIVVFNQKGGVGKTTTTLNLAGMLARRGRDPLVIDLDPQGHLSFIAGLQPSGDQSVYGFYRDVRRLADVTYRSSLGWDVIPAHLDLSKVDSQFGKGPNVLHKLKSGLIKEKVPADRPVLIDACPMLGTLSLNGIFAADRVLVPVSADYLAVKGVEQVERTLRALEHVVKARIPRRYLVTRFDRRRKLSWQIVEQLQERYGAEVCQTMISENVSLAESPAHNRDVFGHAPDSKGAGDYRDLLDELIDTDFIPIGFTPRVISGAVPASILAR